MYTGRQLEHKKQKRKSLSKWEADSTVSCRQSDGRQQRHYPPQVTAWYSQLAQEPIILGQLQINMISILQISNKEKHCLSLIDNHFFLAAKGGGQSFHQHNSQYHIWGAVWNIYIFSSQLLDGQLNDESRSSKFCNHVFATRKWEYCGIAADKRWTREMKSWKINDVESGVEGWCPPPLALFLQGAALSK